MKIHSRVRSVIAAAAFGLFALSGASSAHAQPNGNTAHAFYIAEFVVHDREGLKPYSANVESTFLPFGGRYVVRGGKIAALEGEGPKGGMVMIEFDSVERAQAWYHSPAYQKLMSIRHRSATSRVYIVEGSITPPGP